MRSTVSTGNNPEGAPGTATLVIVGDRIFSSGLIPSQRGSATSEVRQVYQAAADAMHWAESSLSDVVRVRAWFTETEVVDAIRATHPVLFDDPGPALSVVGAPNLPNGAKVMLELEVVRGGASEVKHFLPQPGRGWSHAVRLGAESWVSGLTSDDVDGSKGSEDGYGATVSEVIGLVSDALTGIGAEPDDVVATRHFMAREVHGWAFPPAKLEFMAKGTPTSAGITVDRTHNDIAPFMFECEAVSGAPGETARVRTGRTFEIENNYCRATKRGEIVYVAGTTSLVPGEVVQHPYEVTGQVEDTLEIIRWAIEEHGLRWGDLVRTRSYVVGGSERLVEAQEALHSVVSGMDTAAAFVGVPVLGRPEVVVEIEATAIAHSSQEPS